MANADFVVKQLDEGLERRSALTSDKLQFVDIAACTQLGWKVG